MKIYFEDGVLRSISDVDDNIDIMLDAKYGYSYCDCTLYKLKQDGYHYTVYTNAITALRNEFAWNNELKVPEIYIRNKDGIFTRIDKLTNRELREAHNIMRMYIAGEFGNFD